MWKGTFRVGKFTENRHIGILWYTKLADLVARVKPLNWGKRIFFRTKMEKYAQNAAKLDPCSQPWSLLK